MANVIFSVKDFKAKGYGSKAIEDLMTAIGDEVEDVKGDEITLGITPNRPDLLDFNGLLRLFEDYSAAKDLKPGRYAISGKPQLKIKIMDSVRKVRPYIAGVVVKNADLSGNRLKYLINFTEKFADTYGRKRKKIAIGVHSLAAIKGQITYEAAKEGKIMPLDSSKQMSFEEVMGKHEKGKEYGYIFEGMKKVAFPFIRDSEKVLALIPITNCAETKAVEGTKNLFIDITGTSRKAVEQTANIIACSFIDAGADVFPVTIEYGATEESLPELEEREVKVQLNKIERTLGVRIDQRSVISLANKMGYSAAQFGNAVMFYVPPYRVDVLNEQDIIEDVAIAYGYDKIGLLPVVGSAAGLPQESVEEENRVATLMIGLGFTEAYNTYLTGAEVSFEKTLNTHDNYEAVQISESKVKSYTMLRTDLVPGLLNNLSASASERMPQRLFEIGRVFKVINGKINEMVKLGFVSEHAKANFAEAKSYVEAYLRWKGIKEYSFVDKKGMPFIDGRYCRIKANEDYIGVLGEIHPQVLQNFKIEEPVVAAEIYIVKEVKYEI